MNGASNHPRFGGMKTGDFGPQTELGNRQKKRELDDFFLKKRQKMAAFFGHSTALQLYEFCVKVLLCPNGISRAMPGSRPGCAAASTPENEGGCSTPAVTRFGERRANL